MADKKETVVLEFSVDEDESIESINKLTKANKELRAERNALNIQSEAGKKRAQEINALLDQNTNKIKSNVSAIEKQKINIGNYKSALDGVHPVLGKVAEGLEGGSSGFLKMASAAKAFILTPIGAILAALVAVFTLLKSALSQNDELFDKFENITKAVGVAVEILVSRVGKLGEALIALAQGNFTEAIDKAGEAFSGLGDEIANAVRQQQLFLDGARKLEDAQISLSVKTSKYENEIRRLVVAAKNRNLTFDEQEKLLRKSLALEEELIAEKTDIARRDLIITARQLRSSKEFQQQDNENVDQYINRLLTSEKLGFEERKKIADKVNALNAAKGDSLPFQEKVANILSGIDEKRASASEKLSKALEEQTAQERALRRAQNILPETPTEDPLVGAFQTQADLIDGIDKRLKEDLTKRNEEFNKEKVAQAEMSAEITKDIQQKELQATAGFLGAVSGLLDRQSAEYKAVATFQALVSTFATAQKAFEAAYTPPTVGSPVLAGLYVASAIATGLANVAHINGVQFFEGGYTGDGPKFQPAGIVHAGEVVWSQEDVRKVGGPSRANSMRPTFRGYADGGFVVDTLAAPINQQLALSNIIKNIPPGEVSVVEINRVNRRVIAKENISKR